MVSICCFIFGLLFLGAELVDNKGGSWGWAQYSLDLLDVELLWWQVAV